MSENKEKTVGIIYYTDNELDDKIMSACQKQLLEVSGGKKIVSVSLSPINFGQNIVLPLKKGDLTMSKQILAGLEKLDTDIVFFCEHDVLYHSSHFDFIPPKDTFCYNGNFWFWGLKDDSVVYYDRFPLSGVCVYRDVAIEHYRERVEAIEKNNYPHRGFEPMLGNFPWKKHWPIKTRRSFYPNIDIRHKNNWTGDRWGINRFKNRSKDEWPASWIEGTVESVPGWCNLRTLIK